jgi:UDP-N-acetylenolpyruvoylglucosamine reductase
MNFNCKENINMAPYCSMKVGGRAKYLALPKNEKELVSAVGYFRESGEKYIVVGNCSNLIFTDAGYDGAVISTTDMKCLSFENGVISSLCGDTLSSLARVALENSLTGLEFCYGIPGTVGGAVFMNAGAYGGEISEHLISGRFLNRSNEIVTLKGDELEFGYRKSRLMREELILISAEFKAENGENGRPKTQHGKGGKDLFIKVPLGTVVRDIENDKIIADYKSGKTKALQALFGLIMRELKGIGDPAIIRTLLEEEANK